jgi:hypothetical protein
MMSIPTNTISMAQDTCPLFASYKSSISHSIHTNILLHSSKEKPTLSSSWKVLKASNETENSAATKKVKFSWQGS